MYKIMKRFSKVVLAAVFMLSSLFSAKGQFVTSDPLLLAQQMCQYLQDIASGSELVIEAQTHVDQLRDFTSDLKQVSDIFSKAKSSYGFVQNQIGAMKRIMATSYELDEYLSFIKEYASIDKINHAQKVYKSFTVRSDNYQEMLNDMLQSLGTLRNVSASELINMINELTSDFASLIDDESNDARTKMAEICLEVSRDNVVKDNNSFRSLDII